MIIYNVTTQLDKEIAADWFGWLQEEHIPEMINTGCFTGATILRLLETNEEETITYAVQYHAENIIYYDQYVEKFADPMRKKITEKWGNKFIAFRTVMEVVN